MDFSETHQSSLTQFYLSGSQLPFFTGLARKKIQSKRSFKRHYSDRLQLICQSCHIASHESLISQEKPCEEGNSAVLFIALRLPCHLGTVVDQRRQNKNSFSSTLNISASLRREKICETGKQKKAVRVCVCGGGVCESKRYFW